MHFEVHNSDELVNAIHEANRLHDEVHTIHLNGSDSDYVVREPKDELFGATAFPIIQSQITINGDGRTITRLADAPPFRFFAVRNTGTSKARLALYYVSLCNGESKTAGGGAIVNDGELILGHCILRDNSATLGGAIYNGDGHVLTMRSCFFIRNKASEKGGAIYCSNRSQLDGKSVIFKENTALADGPVIWLAHWVKMSLDACSSDEPIHIMMELSNTITVSEYKGEVDFDTVVMGESQSLHNSLIGDKSYTLGLQQPWWTQPVQSPEVKTAVDAATLGSIEEFMQANSSFIFLGQLDNLKHIIEVIKGLQSEDYLIEANIERSFKHFYTQLAQTPGLKFLEFSFDIFPIGMEWDNSRTEIQYVGDLLGSGQPPHIILEFLEHHGTKIVTEAEGSTEDSQAYARLQLLLHLIHQLVMRDADYQNYSVITWLIDEIQAGKHRNEGIIWLPLQKMALDPAKIEQFNPFVGVNTWGYAGDDDNSVLETNSEQHLPAFIELNDTVLTEKMCRAIECWTEEARIFNFDSPLTPENITPGLLTSLNLNCLKGVWKLGIRPATPHRIMDVLYSIAAGGGAYCDGFGLVDGRLRAWQSLAGLVGAPKQASVAEVETLALNSLWFEFRARSEWYSSDLWDVGILAVRPDKQSISVLAGTNMD